MPYTHVAAPALGFDLARLVGGERTATVLRGALAATPSDLARLAGLHPGAEARDRWRQAWAVRHAAAPQLLVEVLPLAGAALAGAARGETTLLRRLERSLLGDATALDRLVRHELLDWTWVHSGSTAVQDPTATAAADVLVDAAVSSYLQATLPADLRRAMATALVRSRVSLPTEPGGTGVPGADQRLAGLAGADESARRAWRRVVDELRATTAQWAPAMHQATQAVATSDRLRTATDVQLAGVIAFHRSGFTARDAAYGVWNAVSGVLQAAVAEDLLPGSAAEVLLRPWRLVTEEGQA
ncbi:hypothetical protein [Nocardioides sp.]|uniref:hypothetical protein n=1 Tax=Nocardioides sp. TaxID=35761 RepID=UPI001A2D52B1|nr:hypothetical protein [Nocardioides sp.]MBJ7358814.1 hypothetical protein [Nocardioides sp.]